MPGVLVPIVEGQSEERSIGALLRRMLVDLGVYDVVVARPLRVKRNRVVRPGELERTLIQAVRARAGTSGVLLLLDADDDCPATRAGELLARGRATIDVPIRVVMAKKETETWILAAIESVRGHRGIKTDASPPTDPELVRDAKRALSGCMAGSRGYVATDDQPALLSILDIALAARRSPSFAKLQRDVAALVM